MTKILFNKKEIHFNDIGTGEAIVLIHGYLESSEVWNGFAKRLSDSFRVISVDLPGHGLSDVYGATHTMEFMATIIRELLFKLSIKKAFLIGHSLGGYVTLAFLELFPELLSGYCLFHSQPLADTAEAIEKREREIKLVDAGKKDLMYPANVEKMFANDNLKKYNMALNKSKVIASKIPGEGITSVLRGMIARPSRLALMERGSVPCLWILGEKDNYINCSLIQQKVILPLNAQLLILKESGHIGFIEEEELSAETISAFVKTISDNL